jgi:hypothetical protein
MPYIDPEKRPAIDHFIEMAPGLEPDGGLNYFLFALCKRTVKPGYNNYKNFVGELRSCATEIERRLLGPYEDLKIEENGDVS